jgi:hypothetical protein
MVRATLELATMARPRSLELEHARDMLGLTEPFIIDVRPAEPGR